VAPAAPDPGGQGLAWLHAQALLVVAKSQEPAFFMHETWGRVPGRRSLGRLLCQATGSVQAIVAGAHTKVSGGGGR
jgi:hypothetical protein